MLIKKCFLVGIFTLLSLSLAISAQPVHPTTGEPLVIDCLRGTPDAIDGDLSDWNLEAMTPAVLDVVEQIYSGQASWDNVGDSSGEVYLLWDDVNIYIAAVVKDDKLSMNKIDANIWNSDCVEVFFATTDADAAHSWANPTIHYQYGFNANNQKWNWCNMDGPGQSEPDYLQIASSVTADGYVLEASIEYGQMLSLDFSAGNTIGFHPSIDDTDIDNGDTEGFMTWTGLAPHDQSLGYGHVVLSADSVPEPEDPNPVGWWPLNEGSGDIAVDVSGRGNDGTINNADTGGLGDGGSVWVDDPERGMVISFNGTAAGAFVRAGDIPQMTLTNNFTWAFSAKHSAENTANNDIILGNRYDPDGVDYVPRQFIKFTPTKFEWHMNGNGDDNMEYDDIPADVWLHHAVVKAGDQLTYYRNGIEAGSGTITQPLDLHQPLYFGGDNTGREGENWGGLMSDVRIYNRALTELEVLAIVKGVEQIDMEVGFAVYPPVIDGQADGIWDVASTQNFVPLDDPADGSGIWKVLYDAENLYVLLDVTDDSLQNDSSSSWQDDSVEIYFDGGNTKLDTPLSGDDHQYTFGWTTEDVQGTNAAGYTDGFEHAQVDTDTGWRIEVKMPWLSIQGIEPQAGDLIGIDCYYNDDDDGGDSREGKMLSFSAVEGWNDASQWATAVLAADKRIDVTASGDVVKGVPDEPRDGSVAGWPDGEYPWLAVDDDVSTKYLHFRGEVSPTGFVVEPASGASIVTGLAFTTANDAAERDPISFELSGSNNSIDGPYELIAAGDIVDFAGADAWPRFTMNATPIAFENDAAYKYYQVMFPVVRDAASANSMQIAEVELLGVPAEVESINLLANGSFEEDEPVLDDPDWVQWCTWNPAEGAGSNTTIVDTDAVDGTKSLRVEPVGPEN
ncbi:MAG: sugar-binding protein, partial [Planctomycetota bacterium]